MCPGATRKKDCYFKRKYAGLVSRRGKKKALVAVGHKIIIAVYHIIKNKEAYREPVLRDNPRKQKKQVKYHLSKLKELGFQINETAGRFFLLKPLCSCMKLTASAKGGYEV
jgi:hypothetical protein